MEGPAGGYDDYSEAICAVCRGAGDMICCDGRCLRSFHPKCIGMSEDDIPEDAPFVCTDCYSGIQRCFSCYQFGIENELVKCSIPFCGKFYHSECINNISVESDSYVCKLHSCDNCGEVVSNPSKRKTLWRCFRCPKAFDSKHRPRDVHILAEGIFLCIRHTQEEEVWPDISRELAQRLEKRNQVILAHRSITHFSIKQSSNWENNNSSNLSSSKRSAPSIKSLKEKDSIKSKKTNPHQSVPKLTGESDLDYEKRLKTIREKEMKEIEANDRARHIMPKKRPSNEWDNHPNREGEEGDGEDGSPRFSPVSLDDESTSNDADLDVIHPISSSSTPIPNTLSHLARHNAYRLQKRQLWNETWNEYRDFQDDRMGIQRRHSYNYYPPLSSSHLHDPSQLSFVTSWNRSAVGSDNSTPTIGVMSRTNALLSSLRSSPSLSSSSSSSFTSSYDYTPSSHYPEEDTRAKRLKYETYNSNPQLSSNVGYSYSHNPHPTTSSYLGSNNRTEQFLGRSNHSTSVTLSPPKNSAAPVLSRTEQMLARAGISGGPSRGSSGTQIHQNSSHNRTRGPAPAPMPVKNTKMEANDLFAMLNASGLLPRK